MIGTTASRSNSRSQVPLRHEPLAARVGALVERLEQAVHAHQRHTDHDFAPLAEAATAVVSDGELRLALTARGLFRGDERVSQETVRTGWLLRLFTEGVRGLVLRTGLEADLSGFVRAMAEQLPGEDVFTRTWSLGLRGITLLSHPDELGPSPRSDDGPRDAVATSIAADLAAATAPERLIRHLIRAADRPGGEAAAQLAHDETRRWLADGDAEATAALLQSLSTRDASKVHHAVLQPDLMADLAQMLHTHPERLMPLVLRVATRVPDAETALGVLVAAMPRGPLADSLADGLVKVDIHLPSLWQRELLAAEHRRAIEALDRLETTSEDAGAQARRRALGNPTAEVRLEALSRMVWPGPKDLEAVSPLLHDPDLRVCKMAAQLLADEAGPRATRLLLSAVRDSRMATLDSERGCVLVLALGRCRDVRTLPWFSELLHDWTAVDLRGKVALQLAAVDALATIGTAEAKAILSAAAHRVVLASDVRAAIDNHLRTDAA